MARCQRYVYALVRDQQMFIREDLDGGAEAFRVSKRRESESANLVCGCRARDRGVRVLRDAHDLSLFGVHDNDNAAQNS